HVVAAEDLSSQEVRDRFTYLPEFETFRREYLGSSFKIDGLGTLRFSEEQLARAAVKYGGAVAFATRMYHALAERLPHGFDYEVSVDETETPTTPLEHLFVAHELRRRGVSFMSLAPRFVGAMEKGVDWRGDIDEFKQELHAHAAIARGMGSYRLSLHSGSDKFTLYPLLAEETNGLWHVKTAGTSYLVALEVAAHRAPALFRKIASFSISQFAHERASYHISADSSLIPPLEGLSDNELPGIIEEHNGRQVLHVAFGSILQNPLGDQLRLVLDAWEEEHYERLAQHLGRHLEGLGVRNSG
ncbi:MAG: tagaturonate epimerase family protein, partial [Candidatus Bipolaricaulota bacterium]|nr:tagaturonate epimerase family protein [Candidatus Bipolaricaulota bacterium]